MSINKTIFLIVAGILASFFNTSLVIADQVNGQTDNERILVVLKSWVQGWYDNSERIERDLAASVADNL